MTTYAPIEPVVFFLYLMAFLALTSVTDLKSSATNEKGRSRARWWHGFLLSLICIALLYPLDLVTYTGGTIGYIWSKEVFNAFLLFALVAATWLQSTPPHSSRYILPLVLLVLTPSVLLFALYAFQGNASYPGFPTPGDWRALYIYVGVGFAALVVGLVLGLNGRLQDALPPKTQPG